MVKKGDSSHPMRNVLEGAGREPSSVDDQFKRKAKSQWWKVTRSGQKESQHLDTTGRGSGDLADVMSPSPRREAGPCTRVSFSKWMKGMSRSMASPRHFGPSSGMTFVSFLHPFKLPGSNQLGQNGVRSLGSHLFTVSSIVCLCTSHQAAFRDLAPPPPAHTKPGQPSTKCVIHKQLSIQQISLFIS